MVWISHRINTFSSTVDEDFVLSVETGTSGSPHSGTLTTRS
ncbi:hypothetical protein ACFW9S_26395 [Streptomyces anulatus]